MTAPLVSMRGLSREFVSRKGMFGEIRMMRAVDDVTLDLPAGKVTGVVGESGCGKSTLARLALRLIEATSGSVRFEGVELGGLGPAEMRQTRRRMQMVFQDPYSSLDPRYTIAECLLEPFAIQGLMPVGATRKERVAELLDMVGLAQSAASNFPHQLSGGQKQRVGIARALALKPQFVVLDEPTASLDVSIQAQIIELLERFQEQFGLTYLFISHDLSLVRYFCDQIVVMYLGRIVEVMATPDARPQHPYSRALLDSTFAPDPARRRIVQPLSGEIPSPFALPAGCAFAARCANVGERCRRERPALAETDSGGRVACHHPNR
ncbi:MAG: ATP-binding cassette domain-containing protein [Beijerinckiaceae bacterium]|jgi:oligopeptide/dipeptide ABC transporter ATP-binding protein|nr:ATP-binding cassette domain-containing protein [Beijerinckiaceae bacterium]